jgi:hypothetical protein
MADGLSSGIMTTTKPSYLSAVLLGGAIAGLLDILFAISFAAYNGMPPVRLLQVVASGLLGKAAFDGGVPVAILGLALHFVMSFLWAGAFVALARRIPALALRPVISGIAFGVVVFSGHAARGPAALRVSVPGDLQAAERDARPLVPHAAVRDSDRLGSAASVGESTPTN